MTRRGPRRRPSVDHIVTIGRHTAAAIFVVAAIMSARGLIQIVLSGG